MSQPALAPERAALLDELGADLNDADDALQALMCLLRSCDPGHPIQAGRLRGLLQPVATCVSQAADTLRIAVR